MLASTRRTIAASSAIAVLALSTQGRADDRGVACATAAETAYRLRRDHKLIASRKLLLECVAPTCPSFVQSDCTKWLGEVDAQMPTVIVRARDARGRDVVGVRVSVDGERLLDSLDGAPANVDPGVHKFRFEATGGAIDEQELLIAAGEKNRAIDVRFRVELRSDGTSEPAVAAPSASASSAPPPASTAPPSSTTLPPTPARSPWPFVAAGIGVIGAGVYAYAELSGLADYRRMRDGCGQSGTCSPQDVDSVHTRLYYVAPVAFAVGALGLGTAVVLFVVRRDTQGSSGVSLRPVVGGGVAAFAGTF